MTEPTDPPGRPGDRPGDAGDPAPAPAGEPRPYDPADGPGNDAVPGWKRGDPWRPYTSDEARRMSPRDVKRRRGGRPKLDPAKKRSAQLHVLLTPAERDRVKEWAESTGLSVSDYVRRRTLGKPVAPLVDAVARRELNRIGNNLNQVARAANGAGQVELAAEAQAVYDEVRRAVRALELPRAGPPEIPHYPFRRVDD